MGRAEIKDLTYANWPGMLQSELEDFYDASILTPPSAKKFGVAETHKLFTATTKKWSELTCRNGKLS